MPVFDSVDNHGVVLGHVEPLVAEHVGSIPQDHVTLALFVPRARRFVSAIRRSKIPLSRDLAFHSPGLQRSVFAANRRARLVDLSGGSLPLGAHCRHSRRV